MNGECRENSENGENGEDGARELSSSGKNNKIDVYASRLIVAC